MLTIRELIKTLNNAFNQKLKNHRGNWEQNDPTADDYIKNRPFYTDENDKTIVIRETNVTIGASERGAVANGGYTTITYSPVIELVIGQSYTVTWNGKDYECIAYEAGGIAAIGNNSMLDREDASASNEPFFIAVSKDMFGGAYISASESGTHTVKVIQRGKIVKIDKKYLPDDLITDLAPVATSGSYNDLSDTPTIYTDVVRYGESQSLTTVQKTQARTNIGAGTSNFSGSYTDLTNIIVGETFTYQTITINNLKQSSDTPIPNGIKFEQIPYQTTWKVKWSSSFSNFSLYLDIVTRGPNYYIYSNSSSRLYSLYVYDNGIIRCRMPSGAYYADVTFDNIAVSTDIQLNEKYIPDTIQRVADMPTDHISYATQELTEEQKTQARTNIGAGTSNFSGSYNDLSDRLTIDTTFTIEGAVADAKAVGDAVIQLTEQKADKSELEKLNTPKDYIILIDQVNGYKYHAAMREGNFTTYCEIKTLEVIAMPTKIEYIAGEYFNPDGMAIIAITYDGVSKEISDYTYSTDYLIDETTFVEIIYVEDEITYTVNVPVTVSPFDPAVQLVDFEYTANDDGTYTLTGWKGTYNGEASTEIIIPNNGLIIV